MYKLISQSNREQETPHKLYVKYKLFSQNHYGELTDVVGNML